MKSIWPVATALGSDVEHFLCKVVPGVARCMFPVLAVAVLAGVASSAAAQRPPDAPVVRHKIDGRLRINNRAAVNLRVRLIRGDQRRPIAETFTRSGGEFEFPYVPEGEYFVETLESKELEATSTTVQIRPFPRERPTTVHVEIDIPEKARADRIKPGVVMADVDLKVPKEALKHYNNGVTAIAEDKFELGVEELRLAIKLFPDYYASRMALGRELRRQKRYDEAETVVAPLRQIAAQHAESWIEHGIVLLQLNRRQEAVSDLRHAVELEDGNWATHFYLGWALLETTPNEAEPHLKRALELDEKMAARAHLALARIADSKNQRQLALEHLDAYLVLQPDAADAELTRQLAERLRKAEPKPSP